MPKRLSQVKIVDITPAMSRRLRQRWGLDVPTVAGRADLGVSSVTQFEKGQLRSVPLIFRINLSKALRQLAYERAQETVDLYGAAIAADPHGDEYTKDAAKRRRAIVYGPG